jgi:ribosome-associated protein
LLDIRQIAILADYFVICSGSSDRQIKAIADSITDTLREESGVRTLHVEGTADSGWVLLDYGAVIVHVFAPVQREFYRLEELWSQAVPVVTIQ